MTVSDLICNPLQLGLVYLNHPRSSACRGLATGFVQCLWFLNYLPATSTDPSLHGTPKLISPYP